MSLSRNIFLFFNTNWDAICKSFPFSMALKWFLTPQSFRAQLNTHTSAFLQIKSRLKIWAFTSHLLYDTWPLWLSLRCSCEDNDDYTAMTTIWENHSVSHTPNSQAPTRFLSVEVIIYCGSGSLSSEYLWRGCERDQHRLTYSVQTDAECGLSCHQSGNVGYQGTHGGAKVARDPGEVGRWAYIRHLG